MDGDRICISGLTTGTVTSHGADQQVLILEAETVFLPEPLLWMLPVGGLGLPIISCHRGTNQITCYPLSDDLTLVDDPWLIDINEDLLGNIDGMIQAAGGRVVLGVYSDSGAPVLLEMTGTVTDAGPAEEEQETLMQVGLWLAATQLSAEDGGGFGHTQVVAGLSTISPFASEVLEASIARTRAALTPEGRERFADVELPGVIPRDIVEALMADELKMAEIIERFGPAITTISVVWLMAATARVIINRGGAPKHSVSTLLAEWVGGSNPWWVWQAVSIALLTYEDSIPVSLLESRSDGAAGSLFWWLHELSETFSAAVKKRGRVGFITAIEESELRPGDLNLPVMDLIHILITPVAGSDKYNLCGTAKCEHCAQASLIMQGPLERNTLARSAVWALLLFTDAQAAWRRYRPGDEAWARSRQEAINKVTNAVALRLVNVRGRAA